VGDVKDLDVPVDREAFFANMIRSFAKTLEETVGLTEASGYVALVGTEMGEWLEKEYQRAAGRQHFDRETLADLLVDLKRRIGGDFHVVSVDDDRIVLGNNRCPFGELAIGRPSLCRMTSNVFGRITANQLGYARIELDETIAKGDPGCHIVIELKPGERDQESHEYYRVEGAG
jgi:predicted ArsR family transcriptional regulator